MVNWNACQEALGIFFNDQSLLKQAFVHRSYLNENPNSALPSNERLEFLGDAILDFIVTAELYSEFPDLTEGELTTIRASLVCRQALAKVAVSLKLGDWLLLGQGEKVSGGRKRQSNLANTTEALIGAIYLDQGLSQVKGFVLRQLEPFMEKTRHGGISPNYKALLQEFVQNEQTSPPVYQLIEAIGPDHDKQFTIEVLIEDNVLGRGTGKNKQSAEIEAARSAWEKLRCSHG